MIVTNEAQVWQRALHRAIARNITVERRGQDGERTWFVAGSFSRDTVRHGICVTCGPEGVSVFCSCEGGQRGLACQHAAAALNAAGLLPTSILEPEASAPPAGASRQHGKKALEYLNAAL
jgi:hypothetical protein